MGVSEFWSAPETEAPRLERVRKNLATLKKSTLLFYVVHSGGDNAVVYTWDGPTSDPLRARWLMADATEVPLDATEAKVYSAAAERDGADVCMRLSPLLSSVIPRMTVVSLPEGMGVLGKLDGELCMLTHCYCQMSKTALPMVGLPLLESVHLYGVTRAGGHKRVTIPAPADGGLSAMISGQLASLF